MTIETAQRPILSLAEVKIAHFRSLIETYEHNYETARTAAARGAAWGDISWAKDCLVKIQFGEM